jgi:protein-L-isoaspartate(D-aspartate) O-methyltransferase
MVQGQVRVNDVTDPRITSAMLALPRERFVPAALADIAYLDSDLPVTDARSGPLRYLLKPLTLAKLIQAAAVEPSDHVLDVGCATGYAAALLAQLGDSVIALEQDAALAQAASGNISALGFAPRVSVVTGTLREGWPARAPYDVIVMEGRIEVVPEALLRQLAPTGRLVCVRGGSVGAKGYVYRSIEGDASGQPLFEAAAPLLPGFAAPAGFVF